jgi:subtilisin
MSDEDREIGIPPDTEVDESVIYPMSSELPASAWHVTARMRQLHSRGVNGANVIVAVNDTAGQTDHPFLPKQLAGRDFTNSRNGLRDIHGHGTHCLGIVKAVAPGVNFVCAKVLGDSGSGLTPNINLGRVWAAQQGADIISESLGDGGGPPIAADLRAYDQAYAAGASICVAALGNAGYRGSGSTIGRPGSYSDHNHGIAALTSDWRTIAGFSSGGPQARYAAPGAQIVSCRPGGGWVNMSGTSMATPWQAGLYALIIGWRRGLGHADIRGAKAWSDFFVANKLTIDLGAPGWDPRYGNGLVDVVKVFDFLLDKTSI